jgi:hypothetical protein
MAADSDDPYGMRERAPSSFQHENNTVVANEMPDLDSTSRTPSSPSNGSSSGSGSDSGSGTTTRTDTLEDDSTDVPWYEKRQEDAPPPPPADEDSLLEPSSSYDDSLPVISLRTQKSSFSGLTDTDNDTLVSKLDLLHAEVEELKRSTMDGNLSKEEVEACLQRLDEIQNELNEGNHKSDHDDHDTNHDDDNSTTKRQGTGSSPKAFETPKTKQKQTLGRNSAKAAARSAPTPKARKKFQPTDRGATSAPSPRMGGQRRKRGIPMAAHNISPPPSSRPSWGNESGNETPVRNNRKKYSSPAQMKSEILDLKQRRSQKHLSQPEYATSIAPPPIYTTSPRQPVAGRKTMRVPRSDPTAATKRTYRAPRTTTPRTPPTPVQRQQQQQNGPPSSWNHNRKHNYRSASPRHRSPGRTAATRLPKRPSSAPSMGRTRRRVSRGHKMSNADNKPGGDSRPPMTPDLEAEEIPKKKPHNKPGGDSRPPMTPDLKAEGIPKKSFHEHASNIEVPISQARKSNIHNRPKSKRSTRTSFVYTDPSGRTIPLNPEQLKDLGLAPLREEKEKKSKNRARSEEPSSAKKARVERAKKRREQMRGRSAEPDIPKSIRTSQQQRREESNRSKRTVSQSRNTRTTVPSDDNDNDVYNDNLPIGDSPETPPPTRSSFQLRNKEYEYSMPPRATVIGWNLVLIELVLDLVIAVIAFSAFSGSKRECCGESFRHGAFPWITTLIFFFLVLFEVVLLNRAIFVTVSPRSINTTPIRSKDEENHSSSDDSSADGYTLSTASGDDPFTCIICCISDWSPKFLMSIVNFMTILNPYFGFLIAWVLMYQAEKGYSIAVISVVAINIILHLLSLYMQKSPKKWWLKLVHGSILIPFLCSIIMAAWYVKQGGRCYSVDMESFSHEGCEVCPNGSPLVNGNLCGETIYANGISQTTYKPFDVGQLDQGSTCSDATRACFISY